MDGFVAQEAAIDAIALNLHIVERVMHCNPDMTATETLKSTASYQNWVSTTAAEHSNTQVDECGPSGAQIVASS